MKNAGMQCTLGPVTKNALQSTVLNAGSQLFSPYTMCSVDGNSGLLTFYCHYSLPTSSCTLLSRIVYAS